MAIARKKITAIVNEMELSCLQAVMCEYPNRMALDAATVATYATAKECVAKIQAAFDSAELYTKESVKS